VGMTDSTAGAQEARRVRDASGNAAELHGKDGSDVPTDTARKDVPAGQGLFRRSRDEADIGRASYGSEGWGFESLRARSVLRQTTRPLTSGNAGGGLARSGVGIGVILRHRDVF